MPTGRFNLLRVFAKALLLFLLLLLMPEISKVSSQERRPRLIKAIIEEVADTFIYGKPSLFSITQISLKEENNLVKGKLTSFDPVHLFILVIYEGK